MLALIGIALGAALAVVGHVPIVTRGLEIVAGALVGTMLYGPLERIRHTPTAATTMGTCSLLAGIVAIVTVLAYANAAPFEEQRFMTITGSSDLFGAMMIADRTRTILSESL